VKLFSCDGFQTSSYLLQNLSKRAFSFILKTDSNSHCSVSSEDIERSFRANPHGSVSFTTAKFNYTLDFSGMYLFTE